MITANYEFSNTPTHSKTPTRSAYRRPVAMVVGEQRGVPFRNVFKSWHAAERLHAAVFGSELLPL